ncbi:hypothetical protein ACFLXE_08830, partial [Chloroflexota bacterium]
MSNKDVYEELADMEENEDPGGIPKTEAFLELLRLQFSPEEARLALQIRLTGGTLDELSQKTGIDSDRLKSMLMTMADKGTVFYDPDEENPVYRVVGCTAPGLTETAVWGNIREHYTVRLGLALHKVLQEWSAKRLCTLGFPFAPIWGGLAALPEDALPSENLGEAIKEAGHWSTSSCPCRLTHWLADPGNHCEHILNTCIHTGTVSRWAVKHGMAKELTHEEAVDLLRKCSEDGLVSSLNLNGVICNCCEDCCAMFYAYKTGAPAFIPSPFMARVDEELCNACRVCA